MSADFARLPTLTAAEHNKLEQEIAAKKAALEQAERQHREGEVRSCLVLPALVLELTCRTGLIHSLTRQIARSAQIEQARSVPPAAAGGVVPGQQPPAAGTY